MSELSIEDLIYPCQVDIRQGQNAFERRGMNGLNKDSSGKAVG